MCAKFWFSAINYAKVKIFKIWITSTLVRGKLLTSFVPLLRGLFSKKILLEWLVTGWETALASLTKNTLLSSFSLLLRFRKRYNKPAISSRTFWLRGIISIAPKQYALALQGNPQFFRTILNCLDFEINAKWVALPFPAKIILSLSLLCRDVRTKNSSHASNLQRLK